MSMTTAWKQEPLCPSLFTQDHVRYLILLRGRTVVFQEHDTIQRNACELMRSKRNSRSDTMWSFMPLNKNCFWLIPHGSDLTSWNYKNNVLLPSANQNSLPKYFTLTTIKGFIYVTVDLISFGTSFILLLSCLSGPLSTLVLLKFNETLIVWNMRFINKPQKDLARNTWIMLSSWRGGDGVGGVSGLLTVIIYLTMYTLV